MTGHPLEPQSDKRKRSTVAIALIVLFAIFAFVLTRPITSLQSLSPVSGLMALKASAQSSTPYEVAIASHTPTLIEFYADWCTTCQAMAPTLEAVHQDVGEQVNFVMLDIDNPQWQAQVQQFQVRGVPHLVLLDRDQTIVDTWIGKVPKSVLLARVTNVLS